MTDLHVYDTTLRDGAQQEGLNLSVADKMAIAAHLDELGVGYIEGGWPGANPKDTEFFARAARDLDLRNATLAAFGATVCGVLFNFKTTGALVFGSRDNSLLLRFVGVYVVVFATQVASLKALTSAGMNDYLAGLVLVPPLAVFSYGLMRRFVFEAA